jgi:peptidoglycan/LPS O-acetylase OafA/YrhL
VRPLHSPLRLWAAALLVVVAVVHAPLVPAHLEEAPYAGVLFLLLTLVALVLAGLLVRHDSPAVWAVTAVVCLLTVLAFVFSRTVGLPQLDDDIGNWGEPLSLPAMLAEVLALALATYTLRRRAPRSPREHP